MEMTVVSCDVVLEIFLIDMHVRQHSHSCILFQIQILEILT